LFHDTYSPSDPTNFVITIPDIFQVTTTFSGSDVIFSKGSGEIQNYNAVADEIVITNVTNGNQTTVELNRYGVVTEVTQ
ncbi:MAG TPA: hypothetical protein VLF20_00660, partial [Patescibacteria group bacterium]|nr:hypothetical protein [Patescibacteria group bacterium]